MAAVAWGGGIWTRSKRKYRKYDIADWLQWTLPMKGRYQVKGSPMENFRDIRTASGT